MIPKYISFGRVVFLVGDQWQAELEQACMNGDIETTTPIADCAPIYNTVLTQSVRDYFKREHGEIPACLMPEGDFESKSADDLPDYISKELALLNLAAKQFWSTAEPDEKATHPKQSDVFAWLKKQGFSDASASQGAVIIRPEWGAKGRR